MTTAESTPRESFDHGTRADLRPGDSSRSATGPTSAPGSPGPGSISRPSWRPQSGVPNGGRCRGASASTWSSPTGPFVDDPNLTDKKFPGNPTKSTARARRCGSSARSWNGKAMPAAIEGHEGHGRAPQARRRRQHHRLRQDPACSIPHAAAADNLSKTRPGLLFVGSVPIAASRTVFSTSERSCPVSARATVRCRAVRRRAARRAPFARAAAIATAAAGSISS